MRNAVPASQGLNFYLVGLYLKNHGKAEDARRYLTNAIELPGLHEWGQVLAADALRGLGGDDKAGKAGDAGTKTPD